MQDLNSYHVVLANGSERDIKADHIAITEGSLFFFRTDDEILVAYAPDTWIAVELERMDDKGYPGDDSGFDREGRPQPKPV